MRSGWAGDRTQSTFWQIAGLNLAGGSRVNEDTPTGHSTQKPVECMARPIQNHDFPSVFDPFCGSGTTLVAAHQLGRIGYGIEIDPGYVAVTLERLTALGLEPKLMEN
jgi:DNA modification methylase